MKVFIVLSVVAACAFAKPTTTVFTGFPLAYAAAPLAVAPVAVSSQFHAQDELGQYNYGYSSGLASKVESKSLDGVTRGGYSYVDAEGKIQNVQYTADAVHGFRVAATNLPVAPVAPQVVQQELPKPVVDTPEVAVAKAQHLAAVEDAKLRASVADVEVIQQVVPQVAGPLVPQVAGPLVPQVTAGLRLAAPGAFSYGYTAAAPYAAAYTTNIIGAPLAYSSPLAYAGSPLGYPQGYAYTIPSLVNVIPKLEEVKEVTKA